MVKSILSKAIIDSNGVETTSTLNTKIGVFLGKWNALEDRINKALRKLGFSRITRIEFLQLIEHQYVLSEEFALKYQQLRKTRNQIVHGQYMPTADELDKINTEIDNLSNRIKDLLFEAK